jgi:hypothetical protein
LIEQLKNTTGMSSYNNRKHGTSNFRQATHKTEESAGSEQKGDGVPARAWPIAMNGKSLGQKLKTTSEKQEMPAERILVASERPGNEERAALFWLSHCLPTEKLDLTER